MPMAFLNDFEVDVVQHIHDFIFRRPNVDWKVIGGFTMINKTKHLVSYICGGECGYVYFYKERFPGRYRWNSS